MSHFSTSTSGCRSPSHSHKLTHLSVRVLCMFSSHFWGLLLTACRSIGIRRTRDIFVNPVEYIAYATATLDENGILDCTISELGISDPSEGNVQFYVCSFILLLTPYNYSRLNPITPIKAYRCLSGLKGVWFSGMRPARSFTDGGVLRKFVLDNSCVSCAVEYEEGQCDPMLTLVGKDMHYSGVLFLTHDNFSPCQR